VLLFTTYWPPIGLDVAYGGNVGVALWDLPDATCLVAEISSYQA
jgi:UDP-N-acetylmuramoylalanine-D-glutamate ligase